MKFSHATISHSGGREVNEDASGNLMVSSQRGCWVVADGLGGHGGGDIASKIVVKAVIEAYLGSDTHSSGQLLNMFELAQQALLHGQEDDDRFGSMRSTAVVLLLDDTKAWWAHIGDSRLYHFCNGKIAIQTKDHSVPQTMVDAGDIGSDQIRHHEDRNRLTRSLGSNGRVRATVLEHPLSVGIDGVFLLCTDGFWEFVNESEMEFTLANADSPMDWLEKMELVLLDAAPTGHDNYTATAIFSG